MNNINKNSKDTIMILENKCQYFFKLMGHIDECFYLQLQNKIKCLKKDMLFLICKEKFIKLKDFK